MPNWCFILPGRNENERTSGAVFRDINATAHAAAGRLPRVDGPLGRPYLKGRSRLEFRMSILPIITAPDPRLKLKAKPVAAVDDSIRRLMDDMLETMYLAPGIGLAAPQVGVTKRVLVLDVAGEGEKPAPLKIANPEILWRSEELATYSEGCLSLPEHYADVTRPAEVKVRFLDEQNELRELHAKGLLATVIQHEMDHLEGTLFVDHISAVKRSIILRKLVKAKRQAEVPA